MSVPSEKNVNVVPIYINITKNIHPPLQYIGITSGTPFGTNPKHYHWHESTVIAITSGTNPVVKTMMIQSTT